VSKDMDNSWQSEGHGRIINSAKGACQAPPTHVSGTQKSRGEPRQALQQAIGLAL